MELMEYDIDRSEVEYKQEPNDMGASSCVSSRKIKREESHVTTVRVQKEVNTNGEAWGNVNKFR